MNLLAVALALGSAGLWGAGDFAGGVATKRSPVWTVVVSSQAVGLLLVLVLAVVSREVLPAVQVIAWGVAAGLAGAIGVTALYGALAAGEMGLVAPISGVGAAGIPILFGLLLGERPTTLQVTGMVGGLLAVGLASGVARGGRPTGIGLACIAAVGFGLLFILFRQAGATAVFWPLVAARGGSVGLLGFGCLTTGRPLVPSGDRAMSLVILAGSFDMIANGLYILSSQRGMLSLVVVLASLYPVVTAFLARLILTERLAIRQQMCAVLAIGSAILIAAG